MQRAPAEEIATARCNSIHECAEWIQTLTHQEIAAHRPLQRLSKTLKILQASPSRQKREDIEKVAKEWHVAQKEKGKKHETKGIDNAVKAKVIQETTRLRTRQLRGLSWSALQQAFNQ